MNKYSGSNFDDFLEEEGILEEVSALAQEQLKVFQVKEEMSTDTEELKCLFNVDGALED